MKLTIEQLDFPLCIKNKIKMIKDISKWNVEFISGKNIKFKKTNLAVHEPHKIIISNNKTSFVLLNYEGDNNLYSINSNHISVSKLSNIITNLKND